ncbi:hypothetical protein J2809_002995 [Arthrobacter pascens]|uniref:hypothetical protein n=1 Tax=Arthrobacter pascens TaxID=1677 RepID=UPI00286360D3|nr:hypothetical protein [Arthrobacter pascens]MDR6558625.1 hypothetical protein [Arthrobacter pascens]
MGGKRWIRPTGLLLVLACSGMALGACEYADDSPAPAAASPEPSRPAPPRPPTADPRVAEVAARNQTQLDSLLGPSPEGVVLAGSGGLGSDGFRTSVIGISKGNYTVTAACVGVRAASLSISQSDRRGGTAHELALDCETVTSTKVNLEVGPVSAHGFRMSTEPGTAAVAGFWIVPAP